MTKPPTNLNVSKSKALLYLEYTILIVCIGVIILRTIFTEGLAMQSSMLPVNAADSLYSLSVSTLLIFLFILWVIWSFCSKRFIYTLTGMETGLVIFSIAAIIAGFAASDKRLAITDIAVYIAPVLMALLLVQILNSNSKIKLVLAAIAALGVLTACQCIDQFLVENQMTIEQYEQAPQMILGPMGIEPGTLQHFLFEHRLYSRGVRAFFTTRNSAGSFLLMASFAAIALLIDKFRNRNNISASLSSLVCYGIIVAAVLFGLALTRSKGAIIGCFFAASMYGIYFYFGNWLKAHRKIILIACLLLVLVTGYIIVWYGTTHGRLPGGSSMLVRWQYWQASAKMYADHYLTGVGPGNFVHFYPHYKPPSALESVSDPHNFLLSVLTQYGPIGLVGFLAMIFIPLWKVTFSKLSTSLPAIRQQSVFETKAAVYLLILWICILFAKLKVMPGVDAENSMVVVYMIMRFYIPFVIAFTVTFLYLATNSITRVTSSETQDVKNITVLLFCAVLGVMLHNLIDYVMFEPGILTVFWVLIACLIAANARMHPPRQFILKLPPVIKIITVAAGLIVTSACLNYTLVPVTKATSKIQQANRAISAGRFETAHQLLDSAAEDDSLACNALSLNGKLYLHNFRLTSTPNRDLLLQAEKCLQESVRRNNADYKNFECLTNVYVRLADISGQQEKINWLNKAFDNALFTAENRYPGCARIRIELAKIAERLAKPDIACEQYEKAIEIEDSYRAQFHLMYPDIKDIVSRVGEDKYQFAKQRLKLITGQSVP